MGGVLLYIISLERSLSNVFQNVILNVSGFFACFIEMDYDMF